MKLLHISDLHLGRRMNNQSFLPQQKKILQQIVDIAIEQKIQALLIAGDIYDKNVPVAEAVTALDEFLTALSELEIEVFIISGNHDSGERLQFGSHLLEHQRIHIAGTLGDTLPLYSLEDEYGKIQICLLPYVKLNALQCLCPDEKFKSLSDGISYMLKQIPLSQNDRNILMYHGFVLHDNIQPEISDSEIQLGGSKLVDASVFDAFDYVALGHIHKPQWIRKGKIRYSGSIMKYSFSETLQEKSVTLLDWKEKGNLTITPLPLHSSPDMRIIHGSLDNLLKAAEPSEDWIRAELTDLRIQPYALEKLRVSYPNLLELHYLVQDERVAAVNTEVEAVPEQSLMELLDGFCQNIYQYDLQKHKEERELLETICKEAEKNV